MQHASPRPQERPRRRLGAARSLALVACAGLVLAAGLVVRHRLAPKHFETVEAGLLYRSATLRPAQLLDVVDDYGIRTVVNLRSLEENNEPWYAVQRDTLASVGVEMVDLPMPQSTTPVPEVEARWLELLSDEAAQPILVHCQYGVLRTGIMVSLYELAHHDAEPEGLYERGPQFGHDVSAEIRARIQTYLTTFAQRRAARAVADS